VGYTGILFIKPPPQNWGLYAMALTFYLSVSLFVCLSLQRVLLLAAAGAYRIGQSDGSDF